MIVKYKSLFLSLLLLFTTNYTQTAEKASSKSPLIEAVKCNNEAIVQMLLRHPKIDPNMQQNSNGITALMMATTYGRENIVKYLLDHPFINPNIRNMQDNEGALPKKNGTSAFYYACREGHITIAKLILEHSMFDFNVPEISCPPRLFYSGRNNEYIETMAFLLQLPKVNPNVFNSYGDTPLYEHSKEGNSEAVALLLQHPQIDPNILTKSKKNPVALHIACQKSHVEIVRLLLEHPKIDPNISNELGYTPLHIICDRNDDKCKDIINLLVEHGCNINSKNKYSDTPLQVACSFYSRGYCAARILINHPLLNINHHNDVGRNSKDFGSLCRNSFPTDIIESFLTKLRINFDYIDKEGKTENTLLHLAASGKNSDIPHILVKYNSKLINQRNSNEYLPVQVAEKEFHRSEESYMRSHKNVLKGGLYNEDQYDRVHSDYQQREKMYHTLLKLTHSCSSAELYCVLKRNGLCQDIIKSIISNYAILVSNISFAQYALSMENYYTHSYEEKENIKKEFLSREPMQQLMYRG